MKLPFMFFVWCAVLLMILLIAGEWVFCAYLIISFYGKFNFVQTSGVWLNVLGLQMCAWFLGRIFSRVIKELKSDK